MAKRGDPSVLRLVVNFLRAHAQMTQEQFGKESRVAQPEVSRYEMGHAAPSEESLRRMARAARVDWPLVVHLRQYYSALLAAASPLEDAGSTTVKPLELTLAEPALLAVIPYLFELSTIKPEWTPPEQARLEAEQIWTALERFPIHRRRQLIQLSLRASQSWALAERVSHESERAAAHKVEDALELADLALSIAKRISGPESWRSRVEGYCWAHVANARRVGNDLSGAGEGFAHAWDLWRAGTESDPELLAEWRMLDLEASLRRDQRHFSVALSLLDRARAASGGEPFATGRILLKKEHVFEQMGDIQNALAALAEAAPLVESSGDARPAFRAPLQAWWMTSCHLDRYEEAAKLLPQVHELAVQRSNELELIRVGWLTAKVAAGQGRTEEAIAGLEQVCQYYTVEDLPYDAALSSLDLAVLFLKEGAAGEVKALALEMAPIFQAHGIAREALASLKLFRDAAQHETATVELAVRIIVEVKAARRSASRTEAGPDDRE